LHLLQLLVRKAFRALSSCSIMFACAAVLFSRFVTTCACSSRTVLSSSRCFWSCSDTQRAARAAAATPAAAAFNPAATVSESFRRCSAKASGCCPAKPTTLGLGLCSMQLPRLQLQGTLPRAARPQQLALSQLREKRCDPLVLHRTFTACTSASCMSPSCMQSTGAKRAQTRAHSRRSLRNGGRRTWSPCVWCRPGAP
jgi:hypothetical protein